MNKLLLYILNIFNKGWQVSLLILLPFIQKDFHISLIEIGFLSMTLTVATIVISFFAGHINDKIGNRNVIMLSILCYAFAWIGFFLADSTLLLYVVYALGGISAGLFDPIASAIIARSAHDQHRGAEIGNFASVGDVGRVGLTTVTTLLIGFLTWKPTVLIFTIISLVFAAVYLLADLKTRAHEVHTEDEDLSTIHPLHLLKIKQYILSLVAGMLDSFSSASIYIFLPFLLIPKGIDIKSTGFFTALFFFGYFSGRLLLGRFADKHGKAKVLIIGELCMAVLVISLVFLQSYWLIVINLFLLGVFTRGTSPVIKAMIADVLEKKDFEKGYSLYSAAARTSNSLSRPTYAFIGSYLGIPSIFYLSGIIALLTIIPSMKFYKEKTTPLGGVKK